METTPRLKTGRATERTPALARTDCVGGAGLRASQSLDVSAGALQLVRSWLMAEGNTPGLRAPCSSTRDASPCAAQLVRRGESGPFDPAVKTETGQALCAGWCGMLTIESHRGAHQRLTGAAGPSRGMSEGLAQSR